MTGTPLPPAHASRTSGRRIVIVGGGQAGGAALRRLRELRYAGPVTLISEEGHAPYERPPLSKEYLFGNERELRCIAPGQQPNERFMLGCTVVAADPVTRTLACNDGTHLHYDALLLATGGRPRPLTVPGSALANVHTLRTSSDAAALRESIARCAAIRRPLLVVGGSWIGLEVAAGARAAGVKVVLLELGERLCTRTLPASAAQWLQALHVAQGVDIRLQSSLLRLEGDAAVAAAELSDGSRLEVGAVVAGIGIAPDTALAEQCGALVRTGVVVDAHGRTSVPGLYAAGDVTEQICACHGAAVRIETWDNANRQGEAAASHMAAPEPAAADTAAQVPPPWFWSDQYGMNLQVLGAPGRADRVLSREDGADRTLAIHLHGDIVVGAVGINSAREMRRLRKLLGDGTPLTRASLQAHGFVP